MQRALWAAIATATLGFAHGAWAGLFLEEGMRCVKDDDGYQRCFVINTNSKQNTMGFIKAKIDSFYYKDGTACMTLESGRGLCTKDKGWLNKFWPKENSSMSVFTSENNNVICKVDKKTGQFTCVGNSCAGEKQGDCWHKKIAKAKQVCSEKGILLETGKGKFQCFQPIDPFSLNATKCKDREICYHRIQTEKRLTCQEGYVLSSGTCVKTAKGDPKYACAEGEMQLDKYCYKKGPQRRKCPDGFEKKKGYCLAEKPSPAQMLCPTGFELEGESCVRRMVDKPKPAPCPGGTFEQGGVCIREPLITAGELICPKGGRQIGGLCAKKSSAREQVTESNVRCGEGRCTLRGQLKGKWTR
ncbi:MAG: hypothetical protein AAF471_01765 [Myxococcota bacterium]